MDTPKLKELLTRYWKRIGNHEKRILLLEAQVFAKNK